MSSTSPIIAPILALLSSRAFILMIVTAIVDAIIGAVPALQPMRDQLIDVITGLAALLVAKMALEDAAAKFGAAQAYGSAPAAMAAKLEKNAPSALPRVQ